jgi:hypothetical protein
MQGQKKSGAPIVSSMAFMNSLAALTKKKKKSKEDKSSSQPQD